MAHCRPGRVSAVGESCRSAGSPQPRRSRGRGQHQGQPPVPGSEKLTRATALPCTIHAIIRRLPDDAATPIGSAPVDVRPSRRAEWRWPFQVPRRRPKSVRGEAIRKPYGYAHDCQNVRKANDVNGKLRTADASSIPCLPLHLSRSIERARDVATRRRPAPRPEELHASRQPSVRDRARTPKSQRRG
jgi:hypothetical protein